MHSQRLSSNWQLLGEQKLPVAIDSHFSLKPFLEEVFQALRLESELFNKIYETILEVIKRISYKKSSSSIDQIQLRIFSSPIDEIIKSTWGFFLVEKGLVTKPDSARGDYAINVYLYLED